MEHHILTGGVYQSSFVVQQKKTELANEIANSVKTNEVMKIIAEAATGHHSVHLERSTDDESTSQDKQESYVKEFVALLQVKAMEGSQTLSPANPIPPPSLNARTFQCMYDRFAFEKEPVAIKALQKFLSGSLKASESARVNKMAELRNAVKVLLGCADLKSWLVLVKLMLCVETTEEELNSQSLSIRYFWCLRENAFPSMVKIATALSGTNETSEQEQENPSQQDQQRLQQPDTPSEAGGESGSSEHLRVFHSFARGAVWVNQSIDNYKEALELYEDYILGTMIASGNEGAPPLTRCSQFIGPDPFNFLLINSCLRHVLSNILHPVPTTANLELSLSSNSILAINLLSILEVNFLFISSENMSLSTLGLKYHYSTSISPSSTSDSDPGTPLVGRLLHTLLLYANMGTNASAMERIADSAIRALCAGMIIFFPDVSDWLTLFKMLSNPVGNVDPVLLEVLRTPHPQGANTDRGKPFVRPNSNSNTSSNVSNANNPLVCLSPDAVLTTANCTSLLLSLTTDARLQLLSSLCGHLRCARAVIQLVPPELRVQTAALSGIELKSTSVGGVDANAVAAQSSAHRQVVLLGSSSNRFPSIGDAVVPGPHWSYPPEYLPDVIGPFKSATAQESSSRRLPLDCIGIVVDIVDWELNTGKGVVVQWRNGERHVYNCGHNNKYEISLFVDEIPKPVVDAKAAAAIFMASLYPPEFVSKALSDLNPANSSTPGSSNKTKSKVPESPIKLDPNGMKLTKRGIFEFIIKHAPDKFLDAFKLRRNIQNLVKASDVQQTIRVYREFYKFMSTSTVVAGADKKTTSPSAIVTDAFQINSKRERLFSFLRLLVILASGESKANNASGSSSTSDNSPDKPLVELTAAKTLAVLLYSLTGRLAACNVDDGTLATMKCGKQFLSLLHNTSRSNTTRVPLGRPDPHILALYVEIVGKSANLLESSLSNISCPLAAECLSPILTSLSVWQFISSPNHNKELFDQLVLNLEQLYRFLAATSSKLVAEGPLSHSQKFCSSIRILTAFVLGRIAGDLVYGGSITECVGNDFVSLRSHIFQRYLAAPTASLSALSSSGKATATASVVNDVKSEDGSESGLSLCKKREALQSIISTKLLSKGFRDEESGLVSTALGRNDLFDSAYAKLVDPQTGQPVLQLIDPIYSWLQDYRKAKMTFPDSVKEALVSVFLCHIYHAGCIDAILTCCELLKEHPEALKLPPLKVFVTAWSAVEAVRNNFLSKRRAQQQQLENSGAIQPGMGMLANEYVHNIGLRAQFLLRLEIPVPPRGIGRRILNFIKKPSVATSVKDVEGFLRSFDGDLADSQISSQIDSFLNKTAVPLTEIHKHLLFVNERAVHRARGFHLMSQSLTALLSSVDGSVDEMACVDMACLLFHYSSALRIAGYSSGANAIGFVGDFYSVSACCLPDQSNTFPYVGKLELGADGRKHKSTAACDTEQRPMWFLPTAISVSPFLSNSVELNMLAHFSDGLMGCNLASSKGLKSAFERFMASLMNALTQLGAAENVHASCEGEGEQNQEACKKAKSLQSKWTEMMTLLLHACAVVVREEDDDNVLKQIHAFDSLKIVLDAQISETSGNHQAGGTSMMQAVVRLLYYLVLQVVTRTEESASSSADDGEGYTSNEDDDTVSSAEIMGDASILVEESLSITLASSPIRLKHAVSGAESLSDEVFEVLLPSFSQAVDRLIKFRGGDSSSVENDTFIVREIVMLLSTCARRSPNCRRILSKPAWVAKFLKLSVFGPTLLTQQWSLRILTILLPHTNLNKYEESLLMSRNDIHTEHIKELRSFLQHTLGFENVNGTLIEGIVKLLVKICVDSSDSSVFHGCVETLSSKDLPSLQLSDTIACSYHTGATDGRGKYQHVSAQCECILLLQALYSSTGWHATVEEALVAELIAFSELVDAMTALADINEPIEQCPLVSVMCRAHAAVNILGGLPTNIVYPGGRVKFVDAQSHNCSGVILSIRDGSNEISVLVDANAASSSSLPAQLTLNLEHVLCEKSTPKAKYSIKLMEHLVNVLSIACSDKVTKIISQQYVADLADRRVAVSFIYDNVLKPAILRSCLSCILDEGIMSGEFVTTVLLPRLDMAYLMKMVTVTRAKCINGDGDVIIYEQCYGMYLNKLIDVASKHVELLRTPPPKTEESAVAQSPVAVSGDQTQPPSASGNGVLTSTSAPMEMSWDEVFDIMPPPSSTQTPATNSSTVDQSNNDAVDLVAQMLSDNADEVDPELLEAIRLSIQEKSDLPTETANSAEDNSNDDDDLPADLGRVTEDADVMELECSEEEDDPAEEEEVDAEENDGESENDGDDDLDTGLPEAEILALIDQIQELFSHCTAGQCRHILRTAEYDADMAVGLITSVNSIDELAPPEIVAVQEAERQEREQRRKQRQEERRKQPQQQKKVSTSAAPPTEVADKDSSKENSKEKAADALKIKDGKTLADRIREHTERESKEHKPAQEFTSFEDFLRFKEEQEKLKKGRQTSKDPAQLCTRREHNTFTLIYAEPKSESRLLGTMFPGEQVHLFPGFDITNDSVSEVNGESRSRWCKVQLQKYYDVIDDSIGDGECAENCALRAGWIRTQLQGVDLVSYEYNPGDERYHNIPAGVVARESVHRVIAAEGAQVQRLIHGQGSEVNSPQNILQTLSKDTVMTVFEEGIDTEGSLFLHIVRPLTGWVRKKNGNCFLVEECSENETLAQNSGWIPEIELLKAGRDHLKTSLLSNHGSDSESATSGRYRGSRDSRQIETKREAMQKSRFLSYSTMFSSSSKSGLLRAVGNIGAANYLDTETINAVLEEGFSLNCNQLVILLLMRSVRSPQILTDLIKSVFDSTSSVKACLMLSRFVRTSAYQQHWVDDIAAHKSVQRLLLNDSACLGLSSPLVLTENILGMCLNKLFVNDQAGSNEQQLMDCFVNAVAHIVRLTIANNGESTTPFEAFVDYDGEYFIWLSKVLFDSITHSPRTLSFYQSSLIDLCQIAVSSLKSLVFSLRVFGLQYLTYFYELMHSKIDKSLATANDTTKAEIQTSYRVLSRVNGLLPIQKLTKLTNRLVQRELDTNPGISNQLKGLVELVSLSTMKVDSVELMEASQPSTALDVGVGRATSNDSDVSIQAPKLPSQRQVLLLKGEGSTIRFNELKDINGPWTMECTLYRSSDESFAKLSKSQAGSKKRGGRYRFENAKKSNNSGGAKTLESSSMKSKFVASPANPFFSALSAGGQQPSSNSNDAPFGSRFGQTSQGLSFGQSSLNLSSTPPFFAGSPTSSDAPATGSIFDSFRGGLFGSTSVSTGDGGLFGNAGSTSGSSGLFGNNNSSPSPFGAGRLLPTPPFSFASSSPPTSFGSSSNPQTAETRSGQAEGTLSSTQNSDDQVNRAFSDHKLDASLSGTAAQSTPNSSASQDDCVTESVDPVLLCWSPKAAIFIQAGGKVWKHKHVNDQKDAASEGTVGEGITVHDDALCLGIVSSDMLSNKSATPLTFNYIVPTDQWVHLVLSCDPHNKSIKLIVDGVCIDEVSFKSTCPFPMVSLGDPKCNAIYMQNATKSNLRDSCYKGFRGLLSGFGVWNATKTVEELRSESLLMAPAAKSRQQVDACYRMTEGEGEKCRSSSGQDNPLILNDCVWTTVEDPYPSRAVEAGSSGFSKDSSHSASSSAPRSKDLPTEGVSLSDEQAMVDCPGIITFSESSTTAEVFHLTLSKKNLNDAKSPINLNGVFLWSKRGLQSSIHDAAFDSATGRLEFTLNPRTTKAIESVQSSPSSRPSSVSQDQSRTSITNWMGKALKFDGTYDRSDRVVKGSLISTKKVVKPIIVSNGAPLVNKHLAAFPEDSEPLNPGECRIDFASLHPSSHQPTREGKNILLTSTGSSDSMITVKVCPSSGGDRSFPPVFNLPTHLDKADVTVAELTAALNDVSNFTPAASQTTSDPDSGGGGSGQPAATELSRYAKMLSLGIPEHAVRLKMTSEGVNEEIMNNFFEARSSSSRTTSSSTASSSPGVFGICAIQGFLWVDWEVRQCSNRVMFGLTNADASVQWAYHANGSFSHNSERNRGPPIGAGDIISLQVDTFEGTLTFYKNYIMICQYCNLLDTVALKIGAATPGGVGVRPFVSFEKRRDCVLFMGSRNGPVSVNYGSNDRMTRTSFEGFVNNGAFEGAGIMKYVTPGYWRGNWSRGKQHGIQLWILPKTTKEGSSGASETTLKVTPYVFSLGEQVRELKGSKDVWMAALGLNEVDLERVHSPAASAPADCTAAAALSASTAAAPSEAAATTIPVAAAADAVVIAPVATATPFQQWRASEKKRAAAVINRIKALRSAASNGSDSSCSPPLPGGAGEDEAVAALTDVEEYKEVVLGSLMTNPRFLFLLQTPTSSGAPKLNEDCTVVTHARSSSSGGKALIHGSRGFREGVCYWEVRLDLSRINSNYQEMTNPHVIVGVTARTYSTTGTEWGSDKDWGIANNYMSLEGASQATYGELLLPGATLGVLLDMNKGCVSFLRFGDSQYGDTIMVKDLGTAFYSLRSGGRRQQSDGDRPTFGYGSRFGSRPQSQAANDDAESDHLLRTVYPCFSVRSPGEKLTLLANHVYDPSVCAEWVLERILKSKSIMRSWKHVYNNVSFQLQPSSASAASIITADTSSKAATTTTELLLGEGFKEFVRLVQLPKHMKVVRSRAGVDVLISICPKEVSEITMHLPDGPLSIGSVLSLQSERFSKSKLVVLGVRPGEVWYSVENDTTTGAWYFDTQLLFELFQMIKAGEMYGVMLLENNESATPTSPISGEDGGEEEDVVEGDALGDPILPDSIGMRTESSGSTSSVFPRLRSHSDGYLDELSHFKSEGERMTLDLYHSFVSQHASSWDLSADSAFVEIINACATRLDTSPLHICAEQLLKQRTASKRRMGTAVPSLDGGVLDALGTASTASSSSVNDFSAGKVGPGFNVADIGEGINHLYQTSLLDLMVRYSLLVVLNRAIANVLPYSDFDPLSLNFANNNESNVPDSYNNYSLVGAGGSAHEGSVTLFEQAIRQLYPYCRVPGQHFSNMQTLTTHTNTYSPFSAPGTSARLYNSLKTLTFTRTKLSHWRKVIAHTTASYSLPADFGEMPRDICELKVDREAALRALATVKQQQLQQQPDQSQSLSVGGFSSSSSSSGSGGVLPFKSRMQSSLFGQMLEHFNNKGFNSSHYKSLRRSYVGDLDAGQQRAFSIDEKGAIDSGGPYRAFFEHALGEEVTTLLQLFVPCANSSDARGLNQDKVVINTRGLQATGQPQGSNTFQTTNKENELVAELYAHMGALAGVCVRHGLFVPLSLPDLILNPLTQTLCSPAEVLALDAALHTVVKRIVINTVACDVNIHNRNVSESGASLDDVLTPNGGSMRMRRLLSPGSIAISTGTQEQMADVKKLSALREDLMKLLTQEGIPQRTAVRLVRKALMSLLTPTASQQQLLHSQATSQIHVSDLLDLVFQLQLRKQFTAVRNLLHGLSLPLPVCLFPMFTSTELDVLLCGNPDFNVDVLKAATKYVDVLPTNKHIMLFWRVLEHEFNAAERSAFANFCCARSRLPSSASDFKMQFTISLMPPLEGAAHGAEDQRLPTARACFFEFYLPRYTTIKTCREKLLMAIMNANTMEDEH